MNKVGLQDIVGGQLQEKFNRAFEKVVENLQDPNTSFKVKRGIDIKLGFTQNETGMMCRYRLLCLKSWHRSRI